MPEDLLLLARQEVAAEERRRLIDEAKVRLREQAGKSFAQRVLDLLPFTITWKTK